MANMFLLMWTRLNSTLRKKGIATVTKENPKCQGFTTKGTAGFLTGTNQTHPCYPDPELPRAGAVTPEQREHFGPEAWEAKE